LYRIIPGQRERSPDYQKLYARDTHFRGIRKGQLDRSAMEEPHPGGTAFLITVASAPGKYALGTVRPLNIDHLMDLKYEKTVRKCAA